MVMHIRCCRKSDCFAIVINARTCSWTVFASAYNHIVGVNCKFSCKCYVIGYYISTWILCISIRPFWEMVMRIRCCRKSDCFTIVINTSTCSSTVFASVYNNIMCVNSKLDNEDSILSYSNNTWVIGIAIIPTYKVIMIISHSSESYCISIFIRTRTDNSTILICINIYNYIITYFNEIGFHANPIW